MAFLAPLAEAGGAEAAAGGASAGGGLMSRLGSFAQGFLPFTNGGSGSKQKSIAPSPQSKVQSATSEIHAALGGH